MRILESVKAGMVAVCLLSAGIAHAAGMYPDSTDASAVEIRGIGPLEITARRYGTGPNRSSWVTLKAEDAGKAGVCASKYLEDILNFGDVKTVSAPALPGTLLTLDGAGWWALGLDGSAFHVVFARSKEELSNLLNAAGSATWGAPRRGIHPRWMDCFDNAAMTFWFSGFGILPKDIPADFKWYTDNGFTACFVMGNTEDRLIAPGVIDSSVMDWQTAVARKYNLPYKTMAHMAYPGRPATLWNYTPQPSPSASFLPVAETDAYMMDFRRRVGEKVKDDPNFIAHMVMQEMPGGDPWSILTLAEVADTPSIQELWRNYLRDVLKFDLKEAGRRYRGDTDAFKSWTDVPIPTLKEIAGWEPSSIDLLGMWEGRADREKTAESGKWSEDGRPSDKWTPVDCRDSGITHYLGKKSPGDYWLRKKFTVTPANASAKFLHMSRPYVHNIGVQMPLEGYDVWVNGRKLKMISNANPSCPDWDLCYDAGDALKPGDNLIVMNSKGIPVPSSYGYIFLSKTGRWVYPSPSETLNARYFDSLCFQEWLAMRELENRMIAIRSGEPNRPMKIMAPHTYIEPVLELCARYGAYPHDTGLASACFAPFQYSRYAFTRGIPNSVEQGGVPRDAVAMQSCMTRYLMMGADTVDNVGHRTAYTENAGINAWLAENRELLRCIGKLDLTPPRIGILRSGRELRMGITDIYSWDMGRGPLSAVGRAFNYATLGDVKEGRADQFPVLLDCGSNVLSEDEVDALEKYVRRGGIFVAFHNTGMHTPEKRYAWPISRLTGLKVLNDNRPIGGANIRFSDTQNLWPKLRGQKLPGWGLVLDWLKNDFSGTPLALSAEKDIEVVARWQKGKLDGDIAVAVRILGKGKVITLGSTFYRRGKDEGGRYVEDGTLPYLDELLTALGAPRETNGGGLWVEPWRSKNGVYDVYPVAQMDPKAKPVVVDVKIRHATPATGMREVSAPQHPDQPVQYADGMVTISQVKMKPMQSRVYAAPRQDLEDGVLHWLAVQSRQWHPLEKISKADVTRATVEPARDVLPLMDDWQCSTEEKATASWTMPEDKSSGEWKTVRLGSFAAMGLPEDAVAHFRRELKLPQAWAGQRVTLVFNSDTYFWGIGLSGRLWVNGEPAPIPQPLKPVGSGGSFSFELTPAQTESSKIVIALEVDGRQADKKLPNPRPSGVTGAFFLRVAPQPVKVIPLEQWSAASDLNVLTPVTPGQTVDCLYLETKITLPEKWPAKRLFLQSPVVLGRLIINNHDISPPMRELDVSGMVKRKGENVVRWVPGSNSHYKGKVPALNLLWQNKE
ncbi:MAG: hypothetical protein WCI51_06285 [Lentisphaerota bacterium]